MSMVPLALVLLLVSIFGGGDGLKILMYNPTMGHSHIEFQGAIADILIDAGHTVHVVVPEWNPNLRSNGSSRAERVYRIQSSVETKFMLSSFMNNPFGIEHGSFMFKQEEMELFANTTDQFCDDILANDALLNELKAEKYDVAISELYEFCNWGWFHAVGIKTKVIISATPLTDLISYFFGIPMPKSYVTNAFASFPNAPKFTYSQRALNLFLGVMTETIFPKVMVDINEKLQKKFGSDFPTVKSIVQNTSVGLMNAVDMLDISKPISNKIINVGGIAIKKPKATLTPKIEAIFKKANKGVVLFSFGSIADTRKMKLFMKKAFVNAFAQFPDYEFIWKFTPLDANESHWVDSYDNIHRVNWMDQTTILDKSWPFNFYLNS